MKDPAGYEWRDDARVYHIPPRMAGGLLRWIEHGILPGDFLTALLTNDLRRTFERADSENAQNIPAYLAYLYNEAPMACYGSPEKVSAWVAQHAQRRLKEQQNGPL